MKKVDAIEDKVAFQRRKALLQQIDYNPQDAAMVWKDVKSADAELTAGRDDITKHSELPVNRSGSEGVN